MVPLVKGALILGVLSTASAAGAAGNYLYRNNWMGRRWLDPNSVEDSLEIFFNLSSPSPNPKKLPIVPIVHASRIVDCYLKKCFVG